MGCITKSSCSSAGKKEYEWLYHIGKRTDCDLFVELKRIPSQMENGKQRARVDRRTCEQKPGLLNRNCKRLMFRGRT
ncbi:hypothetical protein L195_g003768 [Trifolium pratense]|uniref:Uncharacterized protein n=1 Tax=Trifolium pratense TaxID=57577 RepID=A0A2K3NW56_TRIPR|nr:hypothetical protein L195_g003768 [Trifolium pratense]